MDERQWSCVEGNQDFYRRELNMDMSMCVTIDLGEYGLPGQQIVMSAPSVSRMTRLKNAMSSSSSIRRRNADISLEDLQKGDLDIMGVLVYVESAPFDTTVRSFLDFCDEMYARKRGSDSQLLAAMEETAHKIDTGEVASPLENSADAMTVNLV